MPIYEYEPVDHDCVMCPNRLGVLQEITDEPLNYCPDCGLSVRRVVSRVSFNLREANPAEHAAKRGFTTWKRSGEGTWEKVAGDGANVILGDKADIAAAKASQPKSKVVDLDKSS
jgi:putative FmdB family regulatory protein